MQDYSIRNIYKSYSCPCINCADRHATCHSGCEKYIRWKKERDLKQSKIRKNHEKELEADLFSSKQRAKRSRRKRG